MKVANLSCSGNLNSLPLQPVWLEYLQRPVLLRRLRDYPGLGSDKTAPANEYDCLLGHLYFI